MLQKSISTSSLIKQAAAAVQYQQSIRGSTTSLRPAMSRTTSDFASSGISSLPPSRDPVDSLSSSTSGLQTPDLSERKHIRFDDKVEQCIAVDVKENYEEDEEDNWDAVRSSDSSDDGVMMKTSRRRKTLSRSNSRGSFSGESKTIAKLPSTTLKDQTDSSSIHDSHSLNGSFWKGRVLSPSPSQETLRPSDPSRNFLLEDDDDEEAVEETPETLWNAAKAVRADRHDSLVDDGDALPHTKSSERLDEVSGASMRRTESGMFMPYEEDEDSMVSSGIFGRVVDTVNTAKDIAHVIWNVGWRR